MLLVATGALAFASCGGSKEETKKDDADDNAQEAAAEQSPAEEALPSDTIVAKEQ